MKKCILTIFIILLISSSLNAKEENISPEYLAQWHINYATYLIDVGKYLEALESYNTAYEATPNNQIRATVLIHKANLLATFLDADGEAIKIYDELIKDYPEKTEIALYQKGFLLFDLKNYKESQKVLTEYFKKYPKGKFRFRVEVLIENIKKEEAVPPPPKPIPLPTPIPPQPTITERPVIRVLLYRSAPSLIINGKGIKINNAKYLAGDEVVFVLRDGKIVAGEDVFNPDVVISVETPMTITVDANKKKVRGEIHLKVKNNKLMVINQLDIESYLRAVVPSESYASWHIEALKAQAIAARTYALYQINHRKSWDYDLVDNESDQAYGGIGKERKSTDTAVKETEGLVLMDKDKPILAMYTANSGGYTADVGTVFKLSNKNYLIAQPDPLSLEGKSAHWKKEFTVNEVEAALNGGGLNSKGLKDIIPVEKSSCGRIIKVKILTQEGSNIYRAWSTIRRVLKLPEILFDIKRKEDKFIFEGNGWGHGVGYSQWGSAIMGGKGYSFDKILSFYYPDTELIKMW